ncbi:MAG: hypothetical protein ACQEP6_03565 [Patescibacteria group bacterium]
MGFVSVKRQLQMYQDRGLSDFLVELAIEKFELQQGMKGFFDDNPGGYILVFPDKYISFTDLSCMALGGVMGECKENIDQSGLIDLAVTPDDIYLMRKPQFLFDLPKRLVFKPLTLRELITIAIIYNDDLPFKNTFAIQAIGSRYYPRGDILKDEIFIPVLSNYGITPVAKRLYDLWYGLSFAHISFGFCSSRLEV